MKRLLSMLAVLAFCLGSVAAQADTLDVNNLGTTPGATVSIGNTTYHPDMLYLQFDGTKGYYFGLEMATDSAARSGLTYTLDTALLGATSSNTNENISKTVLGAMQFLGEAQTAAQQRVYRSVAQIAVWQAIYGFDTNEISSFSFTSSPVVTLDSLKYWLGVIGGYANLATPTETLVVYTSAGRESFLLFKPTPVPVPAAGLLLGSGITVLLGLRKRIK